MRSTGWCGRAGPGRCRRPTWRRGSRRWRARPSASSGTISSAGDEIFPILEEELARRFPGVRFVRYDTFGSTHGRNEQQVLADLPGMLDRHAVDAVISGMAC